MTSYFVNFQNNQFKVKRQDTLSLEIDRWDDEMTIACEEAVNITSGKPDY